MLFEALGECYMTQQQADSGHHIHSEEQRRERTLLLLLSSQHCQDSEAHLGPVGVSFWPGAYFSDLEA